MDTATLAAAADRLISEPPPENPVDLIGELGHIISKLNNYRRALLAETGEAEGERYRIVAGRKARRSYNTAALVAALGLKPILDADAARLTFRWTELRRLAMAEGITLSIAGREVSDYGDLEEPMVGEIWQDDYRVEGKE